MGEQIEARLTTMTPPSVWKSPEILEWQRRQLSAAGHDPAEIKDTQFRYLRLPEVRSMCGLSRSSIYRGIASGKFPKPITLKL
jgi:predicted DNA-binding transcriptional regulator AlpA